jgi:DNA-binding NarL/FixJ family response regulator
MVSRRVVLAEDNAHHEKLELAALEQACPAAEVVVFHDGESVIDYFLSNHIGHLSSVPETSATGDNHAFQSGGSVPPCDLLLLDLTLPRLDGLKVLRQLRWLFREDLAKLPPVVVLSDCDENDVVANAYRFGANGFLCKSTSTSRLVESLQVTAKYWLGVTVRPRLERSATSRCGSRAIGQRAPSHVVSEFATP